MRWWHPILVLAVLLAVAATVQASHIRGGTLEWKPTGNGLEVEFSGRFFARYSYPSYNSPEVGDVIESNSVLNTGNGQVAFEWRVDFVDQQKDWVSATMTSGSGGPKHTYAATSNNGQAWQASYSLSARLGGGAAGHMNNNGDAGKGSSSFRLETSVDLRGEDPRSPRALFPAFVPCKKEAVCTFVIPSSGEPDRAFRFATGREATGQTSTGTEIPGVTDPAPSFYQPGQSQANVADATVAADGTYRWDTRGAALNGNGPTYYSTAVMIQDKHGKAPLDFFIELVDDLPDAPTWVKPPSPCDEALTVEAGKTLSFGVKARSAGQASIRIDLFGMPRGAVLAPVHGNPATATFTWTPQDADDDAILLFIATSQAGAQSQPCSVTVSILRNEPPVADFAFDDRGYTVGEPVAFMPAARDPDGSVVGWSWDFGDGGKSSVQHATHAFDDIGDWKVRLQVRDDHGALSLPVERTVRVVNWPPTARFEGPHEINSLDGSAYTDASTDVEPNIVSRDWLVDGVQTGSGTTFTFTPQRPGDVVLCIRVTDSYGAVDHACRSIVVRNRPPEAAIDFTPGDPPGASGARQTFRCVVQDRDGRVEDCFWTFGDGATARGREVFHAYAAKRAEPYTVSLRAVDDAGAATVVTHQVTIHNQAPVARFSIHRDPGDPEHRVRFVSGSSDLEGSVTLTWDFGDGTTSTKAAVPHDFAEARRTYPVRLIARDEEGATHSIVRFVHPAELSLAVDTDGDGIQDGHDVCPTVPDPEQADMDGDGFGDACDDDIDGDGVPNAKDAFPRDLSEWADLDGDGIGDNQDPDDDGDGVPDDVEAVIATDPRRADTDGDGIPDGDELKEGWNPLDRDSPAWRVTAVNVTEDIVRTVRWTAPEHPSVVGYDVLAGGVLVASTGPAAREVIVAGAGPIEVIARLSTGLSATTPADAVPPPIVTATDRTPTWVLVTASVTGVAVLAGLGVGFLAWRRLPR